MDITGISPRNLRRAADLQERILGLQSELTSLLGGRAPVGRPARLEESAPASSAPGRRGRRRMSAAAKAKIAAAARARWAKAKASGRNRL